MANSTQEAINIALESISKLKIEMTSLNTVILEGATGLHKMLSADKSSFKELNELFNKVNVATEKLNKTNEKSIVIDGQIKVKKNELAAFQRAMIVQRDREIKQREAQVEKVSRLNQHLQKTKELENSVSSKSMTGRMIESVNAIGKTNDGLKKMNAYYKDLELTQQKDSQQRTKANQERVKEADLIERNKQALLKQKGASLELSRAYVQLVSKQQEAKKILQDLIVSQGKNNAQTKKAQQEYDRLTAKVNQANQATSNFANTGLGGMARGFKNLLSAFGFIGGIQLFASVIKDTFKLVTSLDAINFSMKAVITNSDELAQSQVFLKRITQDYGAELVTTTNRYVKFRAAAKEAGLTAKETQDIFGTMTKAAGVLGLKTDELNGVYLALEQMISKGKVTTEELRRQLGERLPGAMDIMAKSLGVTTSKLDDMLRKGEVITKDVLPAFARQVEISYGLNTVNKIETLRASTTRLKNSWLLLIDSLTKGNSATKSLASVFDFLGDNLGNIISSGFTLIKFWVAYKVVVKAAVAQTWLMSTVTMLVNKRLAIMRLAGIKASQGISTAAFSMAAFNKVVKANLLGILITGLYLAYEAFEFFNKPLGESTKLIKENTEILKDQTAQYLENQEKVIKLGNAYDTLLNKTNKSNFEQAEMERLMKLIALQAPESIMKTNKYGEAILLNIGILKDFNKEQRNALLSRSQNNIVAQTKELEKYNLKRKDLLDIENGLSRQISGFGHVRKVNGEYYHGLSKIVGENKVKLSDYLLEVKNGFVTAKRNIEQNEDLIGSLTGVLTARQLLEKQVLDNNKAIKDGESSRDADDKKRKSELNVIKDTKNTISKLKKELNLLGDVISLKNKDYEKWFELIKLIKDEESKLQELLGVKNKKNEKTNEKNIVTLKGTIEFYKKQISLAEESIDKTALSREEFIKFTKQIENAKDGLADLEVKFNVLKPVGFDTKFFENFKKPFEDIQNGLAPAPKLEPLSKETLDKFTKVNKSLKETKNRLNDFEKYKELFKGVTDTFGDIFDVDFSKFDFIFDSLGDKTDELFSVDKIGAWADLSKELIGSVLDASLQSYDIELQTAQRTRDLILNNDLASSEAKEAARKQFDERERDINNRKAKEERKNALIKIAVDTAVGVAKVIAQTGVLSPFAIPLIVGLGLAQAALVASQPLPQFEQGTENAPKGWAITQEKRPEPITDKFGNLKTMGTKGGNSLTYLEKGDKVFKNQEDYFNSLANDDLQRVVFEMNMSSNGRSLSENVTDKALLNKIDMLASSNEMVWREVKKLASRPINVNNKVEIKTNKAY